METFEQQHSGPLERFLVSPESSVTLGSCTTYAHAHTHTCTHACAHTVTHQQTNKLPHMHTQ